MNCPHCGQSNRPGTIFCEDCGKNLLHEVHATLPTKRIDEGADLGVPSSWGTARFGDHSTIIVHVRDSNASLTIQPSERLIVGRGDPNSTQQPDIDLVPHGALEKGVSRVHASIERSDETLTIVDMGSSNGTHLNGQRLIPNQPRVLRDGDEVRFGKLVTHVYFK